MEMNANFIPLGQRSELQPFPIQTQGGFNNLPNIFAPFAHPMAICGMSDDTTGFMPPFPFPAHFDNPFMNDTSNLLQGSSVYQGTNQNTQKPVNHKERNRRRLIEVERQKIRQKAVQQAERLAAIHDPTGKLFNVGEVVTMADGSIKSKESLIRAEKERKTRHFAMIEREIEKEENEKIKQAKKEVSEIIKKGGIPSKSLVSIAEKKIESIQTLSKKQQRRQEMSNSRAPLRKPVIPKQFELPEGEENLVDLWDISDSEIMARLAQAKKNRKNTARKQRRLQSEAKKFNWALRQRKKQYETAGLPWDPAKARKEICGEMEMDKNKSNTDSDANSELNLNMAPEENIEQNIVGSAALPEPPKPYLNSNILQESEEIEKLRALKRKVIRSRRKLDHNAAQASHIPQGSEFLHVDQKLQSLVEVESTKPVEKATDDLNLMEAQENMGILNEKKMASMGSVRPNCTTATVTTSASIISQRNPDEKKLEPNIVAGTQMDEKITVKLKPDVIESSLEPIESVVKPKPEDEILDLIRELAGNIN
ncbi:Bgt-4274 [Blumeria graminis f. sp. tritici]|uniref:Bgt-4274 n=2 Tax=Blumeria graminis f. sp. tritici TaxID=62690 RepID=A0A061HDS0_BLUGR|nr:hypothetical protein BGT96224_4274 [Blumeria graminis f. sp. tritici 96224]VDB89251.1 Bgt-4274 [Blumeria graminis f. sp. tritici]